MDPDTDDYARAAELAYLNVSLASASAFLKRKLNAEP
jgi:hypothetical protein